MSRKVLARKDLVFKRVHWWPTSLSWELTWCTSSRSTVIVIVNNIVHEEKYVSQQQNVLTRSYPTP